MWWKQSIINGSWSLLLLWFFWCETYCSGSLHWLPVQFFVSFWGIISVRLVKPADRFRCFKTHISISNSMTWHVLGKSVWRRRNVCVFNTGGESLLIIPQCLCRLICMWLISVWRSCLWSAGRNPDSSVLHNLQDVLEIEFPSPATHEKSVCQFFSPVSISHTTILILTTSGAPRECVFICAHPASACVIKLEVIRGRTHANACSSIFFFVCLFGHKFSFNWLVYRKDHEKNKDDKTLHAIKSL